MLGRALDAVAEPRAAAVAVAHLDRERERGLAVAPAHVDAVEVARREDALLDRLAHPGERRRRAHRVDAVAVARVVAGGDELDVVVEEVRAEADDRLVVGPAHVGEAAVFTLTMPLHGIGQSPHDSFLVMYLSTASPSIFMLFVASGKSREPTPFQFLIGASPFSIAERDRGGGAALATTAGASTRCGASHLQPELASSARYTQPSQLFGLANHTMKPHEPRRGRVLYSLVHRLADRLELVGLGDRHLAGAARRRSP